MKTQYELRKARNFALEVSAILLNTEIIGFSIS
jgi:hypothetical protein